MAKKGGRRSALVRCYQIKIIFTQSYLLVLVTLLAPVRGRGGPPTLKIKKYEYTGISGIQIVYEIYVV